MRLSQNKLVVGLFSILSCTYLVQIFTQQPDSQALNRLHVSVSKYHILIATILVPYVVIWLIALLGYIRLKRYQRSINGGADGEAFRFLTYGLLGYVLWLPVSSILASSQARLHLAHSSFLGPFVVITNYLNLLLLFTATYLVYRGSMLLLPIIKSRDRVAATTSYLSVSILFIIFSVLYTALVLHDPARRYATPDVPIPGYYLPDWLLLTTLIIPRLIMWFLGIRAAMNIYLYSSKVKGTVYRHSIKNLSIGIIGVQFGIVTLRVMQTVNYAMVRSSLVTRLLLIYALLIVISVGYIFIAKGSQSLQKLEDI